MSQTECCPEMVNALEGWNGSLWLSPRGLLHVTWQEVILHMETLISSGDYNVLPIRQQGILLHADIQTFVLKGI